MQSLIQTIAVAGLIALAALVVWLQPPHFELVAIVAIVVAGGLCLEPLCRPRSKHDDDDSDPGDFPRLAG